MTFAKDPASRDHREPSRSLVAFGNESARYYAKVISTLTSVELQQFWPRDQRSEATSGPTGGFE